MRYIRGRNWRKFQTYDKKNPPWIKLYKSLLDPTRDANWLTLDAQERGLLASLWLLFSTNDGLFPYVPELIAEELGLGETVDLSTLISAGFIVVDESKDDCLLNLDLQKSLREQSIQSKTDKTENREKSTTSCREVLEYLNDARGLEGRCRFRMVAGNLDPIKARLNEGFDPSDCMAVIDFKVSQWAGKTWLRDGRTCKGDDYLSPKTLFRPGNFPAYVTEALSLAAEQSKRQEAIALREAAERRAAAQIEATERDDKVRQHVRWHNEGRPRKYLNFEMPAHVWESMSQFCDELVERGVIHDDPREGTGCEAGS